MRQVRHNFIAYHSLCWSTYDSDTSSVTPLQQKTYKVQKNNEMLSSESEKMNIIHFYLDYTYISLV